MNFLRLLTLYFISINAFAQTFEFNGETALETRYFPNEGKYLNTEKTQSSISLAPEFNYVWDNDRKIFKFSPFMRLDSLDNERSHFDIREAYFLGAFNNFEVTLGLKKIFWGVTESVHLVDIINQTDLIENPDTEDKLGQPMLRTTYQTDIGLFQGFLLPYFRERTFSSEKGRFRGPVKIETKEDALYTDDNKEKHIDFAARWSHYLGDFEWGISYFKGTNRDPSFVLNNQQKLLPMYTQMEQISLDGQYIYKSLIVKSEFIRKDSQLATSYISTVTGFEYTFSNIQQSGIDIGVLSEWVYDERGKSSSATFYDHTFVGSRLALNDEQSSELLAGVFINNHDIEVSSFRLEASRRINNNWKWESEINIISSPSPGENLNTFKEDDYYQFSLSYFW